MAIFHLNMVAIQRSKGRDATAAAAYRSGEKLTNPRDEKTYNYKNKSQISHTEIIGFSGTRSELWSSVESHHKRGDATTAREVEVALPSELTPDQRIELAQRFSQEISHRYGVAVDLCIHKNDEDKNPHAHIMMTACSVDLETGKLGKKVETLDPIACSRTKPPTANPADYLRERWAELVNNALELHDHSARVDHRTLEAQGIDREPQIHLGAGHHIKDSDRKRINDAIKLHNEKKAEERELDAQIEAVKAELALENTISIAEEVITEPTIDPTIEQIIEASAVGAEAPSTEAKPTNLLSFDEIKSNYEKATRQRLSVPFELSETLEDIESTQKQAHSVQAQIKLIKAQEARFITDTDEDERIKALESEAIHRIKNGKHDTQEQAAIAKTYNSTDIQCYRYNDEHLRHSKINLEKAEENKRLFSFNSDYKQAQREHDKHQAHYETLTEKRDDMLASYMLTIVEVVIDQVSKMGQMMSSVNALFDTVNELKNETIKQFGSAEFWQSIFEQKSDDSGHEKTQEKTKEKNHKKGVEM